MNVRVTTKERVSSFHPRNRINASVDTMPNIQRGSLCDEQRLGPGDVNRAT